MFRFRVTLRHKFDGSQLIQNVYALSALDAKKNVSKTAPSAYRVMNVRAV